MTNTRPPAAIEISKTKLIRNGQQFGTSSLNLLKSAKDMSFAFGAAVWNLYTGTLATVFEKASERPNTLGAAGVAAGLSAIVALTPIGDRLQDGYNQIHDYHCADITFESAQLMQQWCEVSSPFAPETSLRPIARDPVDAVIFMELQAPENAS